MKTKNKIIVKVLALMLIIMVISPLILSTTPTERISSDNVENVIQFISNSNGNIYLPTSSNIQSAIDDLTSGGEVKLPKASFTGVTIFINTSNITLNGIGRGTKLIRGGTTNTDVINIVGDVSNIVIKNLEIDGDRTGIGTYTGKGIDIGKTTGDNQPHDILIENVYIHDTSNSGIWGVNDTHNITIQNCDIEDIGGAGQVTFDTSLTPGGIYMMSRDVTVDNCRFKDTWGQGVTVEGYNNTGRWVITNNDITGEVGRGIHLEGGGYADNCTIDNNFIHDTYGYGWINGNPVRDYLGIQAIENAVVSNNLIVNVPGYGILANGAIISNNIIVNTVNASDGKSGIYVSGGDAQIIGNKISYTQEHGIFTGSNTGVVVISGNLVEHTGTNFRGIYVTGRGAIVTDNTLDTVDWYGISVEASNSVVSDNHILNVGSYDGIYTNGNNNSISDNVIKTCARYGINLVDSMYSIVTDNNVDVSTANYCIRESGDADYNVIIGNVVFNGTTLIGTHDIIENNIGHNYDSLQDTYIWTSEGKYYSVTEGADITTNLQLAIDDCGTNGWVEIPEGTFTTSTVIYIDDNIWLRGAGIGVTILQNDDADDVRTGVIDATGKSNFTISDMTIDGNRANNPSSYSCIDIHGGCKDFIIRDLYLCDSTGSTLRIYGQNGACERFMISRVQCTDVQSAGQHGISIGSTAYPPCGNFTISDCIIWDTNDVGVDISNCNNITMENCVIYDSYSGIKIVGDSNDFTHNIVINNIEIYDIDTDSSLKKGLWLLHVQDAEVSNVDIDGGGYGLAVYGNTHHVSFNNINIKNCDTGSGTAYGIFQIYQEGYSPYDITYNNIHVRDITGDGIGLMSANDTILTNFNVKDCTGYGVRTYLNVYQSDTLIVSTGIVKRCDYGVFVTGIHNSSFSYITSMDNTNDGFRIGFSENIEGYDCSNFSIIGCIINGNGGEGIFIRESDSSDYIIMSNIVRNNGGNDINDDGTGAKVVEHNIGTVV